MGPTEKQEPLCYCFIKQRCDSESSHPSAKTFQAMRESLQLRQVARTQHNDFGYPAT